MDLRQQILFGERNKKETWLISLFCSCPFSGCNPSNCQLFSIRNEMTFNEFKKFIESKTDLELDKMLETHFSCVNNKLDFPRKSI